MKYKILVFSDYYLPGYRAGGPIRSLEALIENLKTEFEFKIITRNHDFKSRVTYPVACGYEYQVGAATVTYYVASIKNIATFFGEMARSKAKVLYLNSFFSFFYSIIPLILVRIFFRKKFKILLAPRGELCDGALSLKSFKKNFYLLLSRWLYRDVQWQITHESERSAIKKYFGARAKIYLAANLQSDQPMHSGEIIKTPDILKMVFLSRISVKKNLHYALKILKACKTGEINFDIYGSIEDPLYWSKISDLIKELPANLVVNYRGEILPSEVLSSLGNYHLLFLPSMSENFGHVILEALRVGCLVLSSDQIPWLELERHGCGWNFPLSDTVAYQAALEKILKMNNEDFQKRRLLAKQYAKECLRLQEVAMENKIMFENILS